MTEEKPGNMRRGLRALLIVSLALNLLVIGTVGGAMLSHTKWQNHHPVRLDVSGGPTDARAGSKRPARDWAGNA